MSTNYRGVEYLRAKLKNKKTRVDLRYQFYDAKQITRDLGISTPPALRLWMSTLGWCASAVDAVADRLTFRGFGSSDPLSFGSIFSNNNLEILTDSAILGALISSCDFVYIRPGDDGYPAIQVIDGANATGIMDPTTQLLVEGYAVLEADQRGRPVAEAYFTAEETVIYVDGKPDGSYPNPAPAPLLVPIVHRPDASRPFGRSRISRACMDIMGSAIRTVKRSEVAAEFYSFPQKYVVGLSQENARNLNTWAAAMSAMLSFTRDNKGEKPVVGQFQMASQTPHIDQLRAFASLFAGETGLTLDDLGFPSDNPSSSEAIRASHETLRLAARKAQRGFGIGFKNAAYLAACVRDNYSYHRAILNHVEPLWEPVFEPDASGLAAIGDGIYKLNSAVPGYIGTESIRSMTGIAPSTSPDTEAGDIV